MTDFKGWVADRRDALARYQCRRLSTDTTMRVAAWCALAAIAQVAFMGGRGYSRPHAGITVSWRACGRKITVSNNLHRDRN